MTTRRSSCTIGPTAASGNMGDGASVGDRPDTIGSESVFWESDEPGYVTAISEGAWKVSVCKADGVSAGFLRVDSSVAGTRVYGRGSASTSATAGGGGCLSALELRRRLRQRSRNTDRTRTIVPPIVPPMIAPIGSAVGCDVWSERKNDLHCGSTHVMVCCDRNCCDTLRDGRNRR